jgi:hypothetical protein
MKIKIFALAPVFDETDNAVTDPVRLMALHGVTDSECFSDYFLDDPATSKLPARGVSGGYLRFRFHRDEQALWAETEYDLREPLTDEETKAIVAYTSEQWSDGIGENFCQTYADQHGLLISIASGLAQIQVT